MHTFKKEERLCSKILIKKVFDEGASIAAFPLRSLWMEAQGLPAPAQIVISVSKKRFKRAVDRNSIKRRIREAYRLHKIILHEALAINKKNCVILFIYTQKTKCTFKELESKIILTLQQIKKNIELQGTV
jgi:ribonuclease P protein component